MVLVGLVLVRAQERRLWAPVGNCLVLSDRRSEARSADTLVFGDVGRGWEYSGAIFELPPGESFGVFPGVCHGACQHVCVLVLATFASVLSVRVFAQYLGLAVIVFALSQLHVCLNIFIITLMMSAMCVLMLPMARLMLLVSM